MSYSQRVTAGSSLPGRSANGANGNSRSPLNPNRTGGNYVMPLQPDPFYDWFQDYHDFKISPGGLKSQTS